MNTQGSRELHGGRVCPKCGGSALSNRTCSGCGFDFDQHRIGQVLAGRFRIDALIGAGGMGKVYRAEHLDLGGQVAIKFLIGAEETPTVVRERFRREARVLAKVRHPGIVSLLDYGEDAGEPYMVMDLVRGVPLGELLDPSRPMLGLPTLARIFDELLGILEVAHREGVVHRDVKPDNILVNFDGDRVSHIRVLDFGLAQILHPINGIDALKLTQTGTVQGTPAYMSPEQCRGQTTDGATDVYAAGMMLYEAFAGVLPFDAEDAAALMAQHMFLEPPPVHTRGRMVAISPGLERVVKSMVAKRAADRPSVNDLRAALAAAFAGTDADALAERAVDEKLRSAGLERDERALTGIVPRPASGQAVAAAGSGERVVLWVPDAPAVRVLRDMLAVAGYRPYILRAGAPPTAEVGTDRVRAFVVEGANAAAKLIELRAIDGLTHVPVVVIDAGPGAEIAELIAAGASDVAAAGTSSDEIAKKVRRVLKRGR